MKIIEPSFEIIDPSDYFMGVTKLHQIERYARISHRSEDKQTLDSYKRFIQAVVIDKGDWSVTEHCTATVIARVDRGVSHEWVRHRIGSYTQESTRFVNYNKREIEVIEPDGLDRNPAWQNKLMWHDSVVMACATYSNLVSHGVAPQAARSVLPNALATTLVVTYNLRSWRQFFMMRCSRETHPDFRRITIPLLEEFKKRIPLLYDDIVPEEKQSIANSKPR